MCPGRPRRAVTRPGRFRARGRGCPEDHDEGRTQQYTLRLRDAAPVFAEADTALALALLAAGVYGSYAGAVAVRHARQHARQGLLTSLATLGTQAFWAILAAIPAVIAGDLAGPIGVVVTWLTLLCLIGVIVPRLERRGQGRHSTTARSGGRRHR